MEGRAEEEPSTERAHSKIPTPYLSLYGHLEIHSLSMILVQFIKVKLWSLSLCVCDGLSIIRCSIGIAFVKDFHEKDRNTKFFDTVVS